MEGDAHLFQVSTHLTALPEDHVIQVTDLFLQSADLNFVSPQAEITITSSTLSEVSNVHII